MVWYDAADLPAGLNIVTRDQWGASAPDPKALRGPMKPMYSPIVRICFNCTGSKMCYNKPDCIKLMKYVQQNEIECGFADMTYNFMVGADGNIYEGRGWDLRPDLVYGKHLSRTLNLAFIGWFMEVDPLFNQVEAAKKLIEYGVQAKKIAPDYIETWFRDEKY